MGQTKLYAGPPRTQRHRRKRGKKALVVALAVLLAAWCGNVDLLGDNAYTRECALQPIDLILNSEHPVVHTTDHLDSEMWTCDGCNMQLAPLAALVVRPTRVDRLCMRCVALESEGGEARQVHLMSTTSLINLRRLRGNLHDLVASDGPDGDQLLACSDQGGTKCAAPHDLLLPLGGRTCMPRRMVELELSKLRQLKESVSWDGKDPQARRRAANRAVAEALGGTSQVTGGGGLH
jgi:hypothetical protein